MPPQTEMSPFSTSSKGNESVDMIMQSLGWDPDHMFSIKRTENENNNETETNKNIEFALYGKERDDYLSSQLSRRIGGVQNVLDNIIRRTLSGRAILDLETREASHGVVMSSLLCEAEELVALGLSPPRGILLYGVSLCMLLSNTLHREEEPYSHTISLLHLLK